MKTSLRDILHIAFFQVISAIRTRTIMFLTFIYLLLSGGTAWFGRSIIFELEKHMASALQVPQTKTPGAMIETLRNQENFISMVQSMLPESELLDWALSVPILTIFHFWMSLIWLPFLVAVIGAETISPGIKNRSLRYEVLRTGRMEIVLGRLLGQSILISLSTFLAILGPLVVGTFFMAQQPFWLSLQELLFALPKLICWSLPFLGIGIACSMLSGFTNFSRILALFAVVGSWIVYAISEIDWLHANYPTIMYALQAVLPQTYLSHLWSIGFDWLPFGCILVVLGIGLCLSTYPIFARKNL